MTENQIVAIVGGMLMSVFGGLFIIFRHQIADAIMSIRPRFGRSAENVVMQTIAGTVFVIAGIAFFIAGVTGALG